jgi:hypothetical protein
MKTGVTENWTENRGLRTEQSCAPHLPLKHTAAEPLGRFDTFETFE